MRIAAIIPTFNEEDVLDTCLRSLDGQTDPSVQAYVVNAGEPLSPKFAGRCVEVNVPSDHFWAACLQVGFETVKPLGFDAVLLVNSDIEFLPGSVALLSALVAKDPKIVACSPGYYRLEDGRLRLHYSRDRMIPFLLHNYLSRDWIWREEAPQGELPTDTAGGQGVLLSASFLAQEGMDPGRFPQCQGDHDLWMRLKRRGARLFTVCQAGIVNQRPLSEAYFGRGFSWKKLKHFMLSPMAPESLVTQWRFRMKHQPLPLSALSFMIAIPLKWLYRLAKGAAFRLRDLARRGGSS